MEWERRKKKQKKEYRARTVDTERKKTKKKKKMFSVRLKWQLIVRVDCGRNRTAREGASVRERNSREKMRTQSIELTRTIRTYYILFVFIWLKHIRPYRISAALLCRCVRKLCGRRPESSSYIL